MARNTKHTRKLISFEIIIAIAIAICMIFLINFANAKMEEVIISKDRKSVV